MSARSTATVAGTALRCAVSGDATRINILLIRDYFWRKGVIMEVSPGGEIGIHVCLRSICRKACWFKSSLGHHRLILHGFNDVAKGSFQRE